MVKIYVWIGNIGSKFEEVGHSAIEYGDKYLSLWPADKTKMGNLVSGLRSPLFVEKYLDDCIRIKREADETIEIKNLNLKIVQQYLRDYARGDGTGYNLLYQNCSSFIANALIKGSQLTPDNVLNKLDPISRAYAKFSQGVSFVTQGTSTVTNFMLYANDLVNGRIGLNARNMYNFYKSIGVYKTTLGNKNLCLCGLYPFLSNKDNEIWSPISLLFLCMYLQKVLDE